MPINPLSGLDLTYQSSRSFSKGAIAGYDTDRFDNGVFACNVVLPASNTSNGCLFEKGGGGTGAWVGIRDSGATFRVRAGDGGVTLSSSNSITAVLDVPTSSLPMDGNSHSVIWEINPSGGTVKLWVDGVSYGTGATTGGGALEANQWEGTGTGSYGGEQNIEVVGEPTTAWTSISSLESDLYYFDGQLVTATDNGGYGYWKYGYGAYSTVTVHNVTSTVTVSSSTTCTANRQQSTSATVNASASITCNARRVPEGSALINGVSTTSVNTTANGSVIRGASATSSVTSSTTASANFTVGGSATVSASATVSISVERARYGSASISSNSTITASGKVSVNGNATGTATAVATIQATRVREVDANPSSTATVSCNGRFTAKGTPDTITATATVTASGLPVIDADPDNVSASSTTTATSNANGSRVRESGAVISSTSSWSGVGRITASASSITTATASVVADNVRVRSSGATVSSTSSKAVVGREKWERIARASTTWTDIAA